MLPLGGWIDRVDEVEAITSDAHVARGLDVRRLRQRNRSWRTVRLQWRYRVSSETASHIVTLSEQ